MQYQVVLCTELGSRNGMLNLERKQDALTGQLTILGVETAVSGSVSSEGNCELRGHLITPVSNHPFYADGSYQEDQGIRLTVHDDRIYSLYGTPVHEK